MAKLFKTENSTFQWKDIKTFLIRNQYNEALNLVVKEYFSAQYKLTPPDKLSLPNFLNSSYCLTLADFNTKCTCGDSTSEKPKISSNGQSNHTLILKEDVDIKNAESALKIEKMKLHFEWKKFQQVNLDVTDEEKNQLNKLEGVLNSGGFVSDLFDETKSKVSTNAKLKAALEKLNSVVKNFDEKKRDLAGKETSRLLKKYEQSNKDDESQIIYEEALEAYQIAQRTFDLVPTQENQKKQADAKNHFEQIAVKTSTTPAPVVTCRDYEHVDFCLPDFTYNRFSSLPSPLTDRFGKELDVTFAFSTKGLTVGSVAWLYFYERMGIFKILGVLMEDYNYRGKYTISGNRSDKNGNKNSYSVLMDMVCTLHRLGMSSNLRDRICTYQRTLGVSIENNLGIESERNTGFMQTFNKLLDYMLEYYKTKQLSVAITNNQQSRSSVATQTSIRDTMNVLKQQFEPFQYGRNQINTFLGIATVHITLSLLYNIRKEIGIPDQYERPEEFIPAAYDVLVAKRPVTLNDTNRFIVYDNCASYGYRLLTDIETADLTLFPSVATGGTLDLWLDDIEGWVEGYRNAYSSLPEKAEAIV